MLWVIDSWDPQQKITGEHPMCQAVTEIPAAAKQCKCRPVRKKRSANDGKITKLRGSELDVLGCVGLSVMRRGRKSLV